MTDLRPLKEIEKRLILGLIEPDFYGKHLIIGQLQEAQVTEIDDSGSLWSGPPIRKSDRRWVPVEARVRDADGGSVQILLHLANGRVRHVEIFREDGKSLIEPIDPDAVHGFRSNSSRPAD